MWKWKLEAPCPLSTLWSSEPRRNFLLRSYLFSPLSIPGSSSVVNIGFWGEVGKIDWWDTHSWDCPAACRNHLRTQCKGLKVRGPARTGPDSPEGSRLGHTQAQCLGSNSEFGASLTSPINSASCYLSCCLWWARAKFCDLTTFQPPHFPYEGWPHPTCLEVTWIKVHLSSYLNLWTEWLSNHQSTVWPR